MQIASSTEIVKSLLRFLFDSPSDLARHFANFILLRMIWNKQTHSQASRHKWYEMPPVFSKITGFGDSFLLFGSSPYSSVGIIRPISKLNYKPASTEKLSVLKHTNLCRFLQLFVPLVLISPVDFPISRLLIDKKIYLTPKQMKHKRENF